MSGAFTGKTIAITGAAGGIGQWLCRFFGEEGATFQKLGRTNVSSVLKYSMVRAKPVSEVTYKTMEIGAIRVLEKEGGRSGSWRAQ